MVDGGADCCREAGDPFTQSVVLRKFPALGNQGVALLFHSLFAILKFLASAQQFVVVDKSGLIEICEAAAFGRGGIDPAFEFCQLRLQ